MRSHNRVTYHHPENGAQMGRVLTWLAKLGMVESVAQTPYTRQLAENIAVQERQQRAIDRGSFAARAIYSVMNARGGGPVPEAYRPGALYPPAFPRSGVADELLPKGTALTIESLSPPKQPVPEVIAGIMNPTGSGDTSWQSPTMRSLAAADAQPVPPVNRDGVIVAPRPQ